MFSGQINYKTVFDESKTDSEINKKNEQATFISFFLTSNWYEFFVLVVVVFVVVVAFFDQFSNKRTKKIEMSLNELFKTHKY